MRNTLNREQALVELERCQDPEYAIWNHMNVDIQTKALYILARKYPQVRPKRGFDRFIDPLRVLRELPQWIRPTGIVPISHYRGSIHPNSTQLVP
jgi:hypothetical protein